VRESPIGQASASLVTALAALVLISTGSALAYPDSAIGAVHCEGPLSQRLFEAALAAPDAAQDDGTLYGIQRWRKPTDAVMSG
jgi:hypothetical protein